MQIADLIHELLVIEIWREEVFPKLVSKLSKLAELKAYMTVSAACLDCLLITVRLQLYHEATLCNLLEVVLFHQDACKAAGERFAA